PVFVARMTPVRELPSAPPRNSSERPSEYESAVSKKLMPDSIAVFTIASVRRRSHFPPNVLPPKPISDTHTPVDPRRLIWSSGRRPYVISSSDFRSNRRSAPQLHSRSSYFDICSTTSPPIMVKPILVL